MAINEHDPGCFPALADSNNLLHLDIAKTDQEGDDGTAPMGAPACSRPDRSVISCPDLACIEDEAPIPSHHPFVGAILSFQARTPPPQVFFTNRVWRVVHLPYCRGAMFAEFRGIRRCRSDGIESKLPQPRYICMAGIQSFRAGTSHYEDAVT